MGTDRKQIFDAHEIMETIINQPAHNNKRSKSTARKLVEGMDRHLNNKHNNISSRVRMQERLRMKLEAKKEGQQQSKNN
jgi:hypothetical protein